MVLTQKLKKYFCSCKMNFNKFIHYFLCKINPQARQFRVKIDTKCLVLSHYIGAETRALGGLIAQYPKNFEVLALTNSSNANKNLNPIECAALKKEQFANVMKLARVKGYKAFDINSGTLKDEFNKFKKIDISEADYIFVPNVFDTNPDTKALLSHFKKLIETKEHKKTLQILMYESDSALCYVDYYADITNIEQTKRQMLEVYYDNEKAVIDGVFGLNKFRALSLNVPVCEGFMSFFCDDFLNIPLN